MYFWIGWYPKYLYTKSSSIYDIYDNCGYLYDLNKHFLSPEELVNVTYDKATDKIWFHILGQDHMDSTEDNYEEEAAVTAQLMDTAFGRLAIIIYFFDNLLR